jgi:ABC transporter substrate binding protein
VQLVSLAARHAIAATYAVREFAEIGRLMSYGSSLTDAHRHARVYTARILNGAKPSELPILQASKFEFIINAETARILDLPLSPMLLARADEVIRREFTGLLARAAAISWPLGARAHQSERIGRIGLLAGLPENDPEA